MIFIGGVQPRTRRVEKLARACPVCSHFEVYRKRVDHYIALFFIPLIPIKRGTAFTACDHCGTILETGDSGEYFPGTGTAGSPDISQCRSCGRYTDGDFSYCPYCGKQL